MNLVRVDFSDLQKLIERIGKELAAPGQLRNPKRIPKIIKRLERLWKQFSHLRLAQLIRNVFIGDEFKKMYFMEDEELISKLEKFYKNRR